jgi:hypothetical protein
LVCGTIAASFGFFPYLWRDYAFNLFSVRSPVVFGAIVTEFIVSKQTSSSTRFTRIYFSSHSNSVIYVFVKIRPTFLRVLLVLLLLASQQMGMAHAFSHLHAPLHKDSPDHNLPCEQTCDQCLAFASIGSALTSPTIALFAVPATNPKWVAEQSERFIPATVVPFDSRAPPSIT